jgi:quinohemoprotein ethanol dehydrogenase
MQANKNGYFYVIDRETGQPLRAHPFSYINWSKGMDSNFRPIVDRAVDYGSGPKVVYPSMAGAHSWPPMSYSPDTGLVYVPTIEVANMLVDLAKTPSARVRGYDGAFDVVYIFRDQDFTQDYWESLLGPLPSFPSTEPAASASRRPPIRSVLKALDPITGQVAWQQVTSQDHLLLDGGVLSTAGGLVFAGREDGKFIAYDAKTGRVLKKLETGSAIMAAPMSYEIDGHQYVAVLCGHGGTAWAYAGTAAMEHLNEDRVLVFSLDGAPEVPKPERRKEERYRQPPPREGGPDQNSRLNDGIGSLSTFKAIVRQGAFLPLGMPRFDDVITDQDAEAIHANLVDQSWQQFLRQGQSKR